MGTPFIAFIGPTNLDGYDPKLPPSQQPASIPKTFLDAMEVREEVFVKEQLVPLDNEFDADDPRACHWVVYASINTTTAPERVDADGNVISPKQSVTTTQPIGTIRLVPFPHPPHPEPGGSYAADALETAPNPSAEPEYIADRATTYHDGKEAYVKLGRLAVIKEFRGAGISKLLVSAAMTWAQQNPAYFTPSIKTMGMEKMGALLLDEIPLWKGLICVHAQEYLVKAWEKWGFKVDEEMGTWKEEGIKHVGMFQRLNIEKQEPSGQI